MFKKETDENLALSRHAFIYREIQVLHAQLNFLVRQEMMPMAEISWTVITIVSLYTTIKLHSLIGLPLYLFFPMCAIDGAVFFYIVIGATSQTYSKSHALLHWVWRITPAPPRLSRPSIKWFFRFRSSCVELRTYCGSIGFIDRTTPIAIIHFCLAQTGGLILLRN